MLKELLKNKRFLKIISEYSKNPEILDIILFGSAVKGKEKPKDVDLLVIYDLKAKDISETSYKLRKNLEKVYRNIEITSKMYNEIFKPEFIARESLLSEGYSLKNRKFLSEALGYKSVILFKYSLKNMNKSERMRFYYSLYGRKNEKGILDKTNSHKFAESIILSTIEGSDMIRNFLKKWNIENLEFPIIMPEKMLKHKILNKD